MLQLTRFTTVYEPMQDRLALTGRDAGGHGVTIWLTQRFALRLLPTLFAQLDRSGPAQAVRPNVSAVAPDALRAQAVQAFRQQAARAQQPRLEPVRPHPDSHFELLATEARLGRQGPGLRVLFLGAAGEAAALVLLPLELRQWLDIVHRHWRNAEWPLTIWPAWIVTAAAPAAAGRGYAH